ncbi:hypothetical protein [Rhizobium sp. 18065]|uniref:hypothetical protein n=1 Tax=Rhizobium sp. 18065 TaxID=2681411 RepID=UPI001359BB6B|nr:hypothetical protein [Rhizobium sp. 18065]
MEVYNYHPETGAYCGATLADESPREPGVFLFPAFSTMTAPPEYREGFVRRFVDGAWGYSPEAEPATPPTEEPVIPDPLTLPMERLDFWRLAARVQVSKYSVRARLEAMPEETPEERLTKYDAIAWFEEAKQYRRYDLLLISLAEAEGITSDQLDALWSWAA